MKRCIGLMLVALAACLCPSRAAEEVGKLVDLDPGICVLLGRPRGISDEQIVEAAARPHTTIYCQTLDAEWVQQLRAKSIGTGVWGKSLYAEVGSFARVHLADNLAGRIYVSEKAGEILARAELLRILHPGGRAFVGGTDPITIRSVETRESRTPTCCSMSRSRTTRRYRS